MPGWLALIIIVSVVGGLLLPAFGQWLKFKEKQIDLGTSTNELKDTVAAQQEELEAAVRRIQNLEAIVTSQTWDVLHDDELPEPEKQRALADARLRLDNLDEPSDAERAEQLARRLRT